MANTYTPLGEMLRLYRVMTRQTVRDLAPQMGLSIATLSRIERGHALDATTLLKVVNWMLEKQR